MPVQLEQPILDDGVKFVHFFEGRILSGQDLRDQQLADRTQRRQVARGVGAGVVEGLEVEIDDPGSGGDSPVLKVLPGLALNAEGDPLECAQPAKVELVRTLEEEDGSQSVFGACTDIPPGVEIPNGIGFYVLTIGPASGFQGNAPKSGLDSGGTAAGCGRRYATFGVQFRLLKLEPTTFSDVPSAVKTQIATLASLTDAASQSLLRNLLAHLCLGTPQTRSHPEDPFLIDSGTSAYLRYGALDDLRATGTLTDCEVPLALFSWTMTGIGFLDLWAVRRRIVRHTADRVFPLHAAERRRAEAEAAFFQFQRHASELRDSSANPGLIRADQYFRYLPAAGYLPLATAAHAGFTASTFYQGLTTEGPHGIDGGRILPLFDLSSSHRPIDLQGGGSPPLIWRYTADQNTSAPSSVQRYEVFATGLLPYQGDPLFEVTMTAKCAECEARLEELEDQIEALEDAIEAAVASGVASSTINGTVRDGSGAVLAGVIVQLQGGTAERNATTNAIGAFTFPGLTAGTYTARVSVTGFTTVAQTVTVAVGETRTITLTLTASGGATGGLFGTIVDDSGLVLPGVDVMIVNQVTGFSWTVVTDAEGNYVTGPLPEGDYRIVVTPPDVDPFEMTNVRVNTGSRSFVSVSFGG